MHSSKPTATTGMNKYYRCLIADYPEYSTIIDAMTNEIWDGQRKNGKVSSPSEEQARWSNPRSLLLMLMMIMIVEVSRITYTSDGWDFVDSFVNPNVYQYLHDIDLKVIF